MGTEPMATDGLPAEPSHEQTIVALVENKAGVLARIVGLFARRGFNIVSLNVAPTDDDRFSRITFVYDTHSAPVEQVVNQVNKLINVISIEAPDPTTSLERDMLLASIKAVDSRPQVLDLVEEFDGDVIDESESALTVLLAGEPRLLDDFENRARVFGIVEMQRTGRVALPLL